MHIWCIVSTHCPCALTKLRSVFNTGAMSRGARCHDDLRLKMRVFSKIMGQERTCCRLRASIMLFYKELPHMVEMVFLTL